MNMVSSCEVQKLRVKEGIEIIELIDDDENGPS
jgi:hypothetical protein